MKETVTETKKRIRLLQPEVEERMSEIAQQWSGYAFAGHAKVLGKWLLRTTRGRIPPYLIHDAVGFTMAHFDDEPGKSSSLRIMKAWAHQRLRHTYKTSLIPIIVQELNFHDYPVDSLREDIAFDIALEASRCMIETVPGDKETFADISMTILDLVSEASPMHQLYIENCPRLADFDVGDTAEFFAMSLAHLFKEDIEGDPEPVFQAAKAAAALRAADHAEQFGEIRKSRAAPKAATADGWIVVPVWQNSRRIRDYAQPLLP